MYRHSYLYVPIIVFIPLCDVHDDKLDCLRFCSLASLAVEKACCEEVNLCQVLEGASNLV